MSQNIEELELNYATASNALNDYREKNGFIPEARVIAKYREATEMRGVIAPFGKMWAGCHGFLVPVTLDNGRTQNWALSNLKLAVWEFINK